MTGLQRLMVLLFASALAGCAAVEKLSGKERIEDEPPKDLVKIEESVQVRQDWKYNVGGAQPGHIQLVPALQDGTLFTANPGGKISAIDPGNGKLVWQATLDHVISGAVGVGDDIVLAGTPEGIVVALDAYTGNELWSQQLSSEILAPPAAQLGVSVVRTIDGHVYGLSSDDGGQQWVFHRRVPTLSLHGNSAPLVIKGAVVAGFANGKIVAADLTDGTILWDISVAQASGRNEVERMIDIDSTPVLVGSVLYVSAFQGAITALALGSRRILWSREFSIYTQVSADDENIYISDERGVVRALDRLTGETVWEQTDLLRRQLSGPVALGRYVVVSDFAGYVHVLRKTDGKIVGRRKLGGGGFAGAPIVYRDTIFTMNEKGELLAISLQDS